MTVGDSESAIHRRLGTPTRVRQRSVDYEIHEWATMSIAFKHGAAIMLIAEHPSVGQTRTGVAVGSSWRDLERTSGPVRYDSVQSLWTSAADPGVWYEVVRPARPDEQPIDPPFIDESYAVTDPEHAQVRRIYVLDG